MCQYNLIRSDQWRPRRSGMDVCSCVNRHGNGRAFISRNGLHVSLLHRHPLIQLPADSFQGADVWRAVSLGIRICSAKHPEILELLDRFVAWTETITSSGWLMLMSDQAGCRPWRGRLA